jgi:putative heme-binding domain-containing protein
VKEAVHSLGQLVWRYHPETRRYEIFAEGGGNAFGLEIDAKGRIYSGHNGGDTRGFHYVQGGYYQKGFTKHGSLSNPYAYGYFPAMKHHSVPRFTHTFLIYEEEKLPPLYRGKLFGVEPLQGRVVLSEVTRDRSSFKTRDLSRPISTDDQWFRPVDIKTGPDGAVYVADLYEQRIDHSSHYAGRIDRSTGRVYRLKSKDAAPERHGGRSLQPFDYGKLSSRELVALLAHPGKWHRQTALRLLGDRKDKSVLPLLRKTIEEKTGQLALESLWALNLSGGLTDEVAMKTLDHADPYVRLWTARLLCDNRSVAPAVAKKLAERARREMDVEARSQLACSARRLPARDGLPIIRGLLVHDEDVADVHLPLLLWWAIEAKAGPEPEAVLALFADKTLWELPLVRQHITERLMRRFAQAGTRKDLLVCARLLELAPGAEHARLLMTGFEKAFQGRSLAGLPDELVKVMARVGGGSPALRLRQGDASAVADALKVLGNEKADKRQRRQFAQVFGEVRQPRCVPVLLRVVEQSRDDVLRQAALTALQAYPDASIGVAVVRLYKQLPEDVRSVAQTLLASRKPWAQELVKAVEAGKIERAAVPAVVVRKILLHDDKQLAAKVRKLWGDVQGATTAQMRQRIEQLAKMIRTGSGNPYSGRKLYMQNCGKCHTLFGEGGQIGPDLTPYQRNDLDRLLVNVVNPSAEIREGFESYIVATKNGRILNGFLADQDNRVVVLRGIDGQNIVIPRSQIEELRKSDRSVMPEETLKGLSDQQVRDLFAYLRSSQPLP